MKIDDIFAAWDVDCKIDITKLEFESLKISELHNKYSKIYFHEKLVLRNLKAKASKLKLDKSEFYVLGPNEETKAAGWELPPRGKVYKPDLPGYLDADKDIIALNLKVGMQEEKIDLLKSILDSIARRSFQIREANQFMGFVNGK